MATNPIQRQKRNSFLLGMLLMLVIASIVIALLFMQLVNMKKKEKEVQESYKSVYVLPNNVKSGEKIEFSVLKQMQAVKDYVPGNIVNISNFTDENGNIRDDIVAKIEIKSGTILTSEMINPTGEKVTSDLRKQEYNMVILPSQIEDEDYIDIRLRLPSGQDYIVVSKKKVTIPKIGGIDSEDTIWMNLDEIETMTMSNAIVEAYKLKGSQLYAAMYVEPGMQQNAIPTYVVSKEVLEAINADSNIIQEAKQALWNRYNNSDVSNQRNGAINNALGNLKEEEAKTNLELNVESHATRSKEIRKDYLDALNGVVK